MSERSTPATLRAAIEEQAPERAVAAATRFESASIPDRLDRLATAVREERYDDADVQLRRLVDQYEADRPETRRQVANARAAQSTEDVTLDQQQTLAEYTRSVTATQAKRAQALARAGELVLTRGGSDQPPASVAETVAETRTQEETRQDRRARARSVLESVSLPATLSIPRFAITPERIGTGETTTVSVALANTGDRPATEVTATVTTSSETTRLDYGSLQPGTSADRRVVLTPTESGARTLTVRAEAAETGTVSRNETLVVTSSGPGVLPGQNAPATDPDGDGIYEDINGNNRFEFRDVVELLFAIENVDPADAEFLDVDDDGKVGFTDVVALIFEIN